jgi:fermentation-respiration switch protein FrsA (DUF1100 family)
MRMTRRIAHVALALLLLATGALVAVAWYGSEIALRPAWYEHRSPHDGLGPRDGDAFAIEGWQSVFRDPGQDLGLAFEAVEFPAVDGSTLRGWWVPGESGARAGVVTVHGAGADRREFLRHVPVFHVLGYPVLLFDCREHGISDGTAAGISLGIREHHDVSSAVAYMKQVRGLERVGVVGTSQGGASVILAAAADESIDAVVAENPFTSIRELIAVGGARSGRETPELLLRLITFTTLWRMGGLDVPAPIEVVAEIAPRPLLLMHGDADRVIPVQQTRDLYLATSGHAELWIAPGAEHARLYNSHSEEWAERVQSLLLEGLGPPIDWAPATESPAP